jgi:predicted GH43/DUF377 family glycosyl hydrolase
VHRRLVSRGDLPGSDGGVYNPGAILTDEGIVLLARREIDYRFTTVVHAERIVLDPDTLALRSHRTLARRGFPDDARLEDFRLLEHGGETLVVHTMVRPSGIRPVLSRLGARTIELVDPLDLPVETTRIEKNWVLFEASGRLHCLYKLDPLTIFARGDDGAWRLVKRAENGWSRAFTGNLSNSANLVPFMGGHLGFWHSIVDGRYVQGAVWLDRKLDIRFATGVLLDGRHAERGYKPGVLYVSGLVVHGGKVHAFLGEGDAHTGVATFDAAALEAELRRHPFVPTSPLKVRIEPSSMGALFRAMKRLDGLSRRAPHRALWVHVPERNLHPIVRRFGIRGLMLQELDNQALDYRWGAGKRSATRARREA